jgi:signal transduction histidine kinase
MVIFMRRAIDPNIWLERLLYWLLLGWYCGLVYGLVTLLVTWPARPITSLAQLPWWSAVPALIVVVLSYGPVTRYLGQSVHHLIYGQHDDAYAMMARVSDQLYTTTSPDVLLPTLNASLAATLRLPYVAVQVNVEPTVSAHYGRAPTGAEIVSVPVRYRDLTLGTLSASARRPNARLSASDQRLLGDVARQVGITLYATQLSEALQSSREQIVLAHEEERRRIRRDLHDELGPTLAALRMQLGALRRTVQQHPAAADQLIADLQEDVLAATAEVRRIVYNLRPPLLDEFGLLDAIRNLNLGDDKLVVCLDAPDTLPVLPAALEVALYRIVTEALHNVVRHAQAQRCCIRLVIEGAQLVLTVSDDGGGLPPAYLPGVGHTAMHERAAELGGKVTITAASAGGTLVTAVFPWKEARHG